MTHIDRRQFLAGALAILPSAALLTADPDRRPPRMPDEAAPHTRTWMCWPHVAAIYEGERALKAVRRDLVRLARAISAFEPVAMVVHPDDRRKARALLGREIELLALPVDDLWMRDSGPVFVIDDRGALAACGLNFNGWGRKQRHRRDRRVAERVAHELGVPFTRAELVAEGGAFEVDGAGTLLAAESSIINRNRNPGKSKSEIEAALTAAVGATRFIWVPGIRGKDITDYHVDAVARLVRPGVAVVELPPAGTPKSIWTRAAHTNLERIRDARDQQGRRMEVALLTQPRRVRVAAPDFVNCYANYYVVNGAVIAPEFGDHDADERAADTLARLYPGRRVVQINIDTIATFGGGLHCVTQQQPAL